MATRPANREDERLAALASYQILDTPPEEAFDRLTAFTAKVLDVPIALISFVDRDRQWFKSKVGLDVTQTPRNQAFCDYTIRSCETLIIPDAREEPRFADNALVTGEPFIRFYAGAPLTTKGGHNLGTLCVIDTEPRAFDERQVSILGDLAAIIVTELELRRAANTDALTGMLNRHRFFEVGEQEVRRARRYENALSILMLDIDRFKTINDRYGHQTGDRVLTTLSDACRDMLREQDIQGRLGGEEFAIILPHTGSEDAHTIAERIRRAASELDVVSEGEQVETTLSIGLTCRLDSDKCLGDILQRADEALYDAKNQGRNRVNLSQVA